MKSQTGIWGLDLKPRRNGPRPRPNRYSTKTRWMPSLLLALGALGYFIVAVLW